MIKRQNPYPLRIDTELMEKFKIIAKNNGRSVNKEIEQMILLTVSNYEKAHGPIPIPDSSEPE